MSAACPPRAAAGTTLYRKAFFSIHKLELNLDKNGKEPINPQQRNRNKSYCTKDYINRELRHSKLGHLSPIDDEKQIMAARTLTMAGP